VLELGMTVRDPVLSSGANVIFTFTGIIALSYFPNFVQLALVFDNASGVLLHGTLQSQLSHRIINNDF